MSGPKPSYPIQLTDAEQKHLEQLVRAHKSGRTQVMRAQILLTAHAHPEWSNQQIAKEARTSDRVVRRWRERWVTTHSIADAPRSGAPRHFSPSDPRPSDRNRLQFTETLRSAAESLEPCGHSSTSQRGVGKRENAFQQNRGTLAQSRATATVALP